MPTSNYMGDYKVEIAFNAGANTPAASRTWTDVSTYVELAEGITISGGRQNERSVADANQCSLTLDNSDGRFTAGLVTSPYYPNVKLDRPIRVTATPVDGSISTRFLGYVNEWPVEWDGTSTYASAHITASSRLSRLGYTAALRSILEQAILADSPAAYYPLGEPAGSLQANDESGRGAPPLTMSGDGTAVVFGTATGPVTDSLTAATFAGGQFLRASGMGALPTTVSVETFFSCPAVPVGASARVVALGTVMVLSLTTSGAATGAVFGGSAVTGGVNLCDGAVHHLAGTWDGTTFRLYVDGASIGSVASGTWAGGDPAEILAGETGSPAAFFLKSGFVGSMAHIATYTATLSAGQVLAHWQAGTTGFAGETTDARLKRYAAYAGIPAAEVNAEAGSTTVAHIDTTDQQVVELMRQMETTEAGVLYDERDGTLTFHNRAHRYVVSAAFTLDMTEHEVEASYQPLLDRSYIINDATAANSVGTISARKVDATSQADYWPMTASLITASDDPNAPLQAASWLVFAYKDPRVRVASCGVDALAQVGKTPNCAAVLAATVGSKVTISNHPSQAASSSASYFIEGWTETVGPESLRLTWNLSPTAPWDQTLVLSDSTRGVLGTYALAY